MERLWGAAGIGVGALHGPAIGMLKRRFRQRV
jgi:hypothetical protein